MRYWKRVDKDGNTTTDKTSGGDGLMEIDVKKEITRVQGEIQQLSAQGNLLSNNITTLQQQRQEVINQVIMKQGQLELLERLNGKKEVE